MPGEGVHSDPPQLRAAWHEQRAGQREGTPRQWWKAGMFRGYYRVDSHGRKHAKPMAARFYILGGEVAWLLLRRVLVSITKRGRGRTRPGHVGFAMGYEKDCKRPLGIAVREGLLARRKSEMLLNQSGNSSQVFLESSGLSRR